jgi:hypothetical protein
MLSMTDQSIPQAVEQTEASKPQELRIPGVYKDDDLVYVDPDLRKVVGLVEFSKAGNPKSLVMKEVEEDEEDGKEELVATATPAKGKDDKGRKDRAPRRRVRRQRFYPWGTYRSMKRIYKLEGKVHREETQKTLDEVMEKALQEPFWD